MERIVITGIGVVGPHGSDMAGLLSGTPQWSPWPENVQQPHPSAVIARVGDFPAKRFFTDRQLRMLDRAMSLSSSAAGLAIDDAQLDAAMLHDACTFLGTARAELPSCYQFIQPRLGGKADQLNAADFPKIARNISCGQVAIRYGMCGPSTVLASGPLASMEAITRAAGQIRAGSAKVALVGGYESLSKFSLFVLAQLNRQHLGQHAPQFFGERAGFLAPSEGACMLVLESASHAQARGARIYCSLDAWLEGRAGDDEDMADVLRQRWLRTMERAGAAPDGLGVVSVGAGGSNRPQEVAETHALGAFVEAHAPQAQVFAVRSLTGEGDAWSAALQVAAAAHMVAHGEGAASAGVAGDAPALLRQRAQGGALAHRSALVSGVGGRRNYCAIHLSAFQG
ncbi:hypothetical protein GJ700_28650 [Duganella sp. FT92W]|uniref:Beta-ketoacyl synthase-like N-terminal domain-containing protein n=1 Tax=Pseudoduganella rivuli TaxID=2666085 RepID=A0A7X2ITF3_9BURK|nr:beta-ketoacyl synthase N-terminal-like domain-containing protein [Pseudoduganella rivuli]MRV75694.1 hypothetical protein [Pseudoduganella rivuli]